MPGEDRDRRALTHSLGATAKSKNADSSQARNIEHAGARWHRSPEARARAHITASTRALRLQCLAIPADCPSQRAVPHGAMGHGPRPDETRGESFRLPRFRKKLVAHSTFLLATAAPVGAGAGMSSSFLRAVATRALDAATPVGVAKARTLPPIGAAPVSTSQPIRCTLPPIGAVPAAKSSVCSLPPINLPMEKPQRVRQRSAAEQAALEDEMADMYAQLGVDRNADLMSALKPKLTVPMPEPQFALSQPEMSKLQAQFSAAMTASTAPVNGAATAPTTQ